MSDDQARRDKLYEDLYVLYYELYQLRHPSFGAIFNIVLNVLAAFALIQLILFLFIAFFLAVFGAAILGGLGHWLQTIHILTPPSGPYN
jgi:ABC-type multidrug transport system permease subunit